ARQESVQVYPGRLRVVVAQAELGLFARHSQALDQTDAPVHPRQPAATIIDATAHDLKSQTRPGPDVQAEQSGVNVRAQRVNVVQEEILQLRSFHQHFGEHTVA